MAKAVKEERKSENEGSLEEIMEELSLVVARLESEQLSLEESYQCFSKGMELVMKGNEAIDKVEKKMEILIAGDNPEEELN